jgi:FkbM family methyltransferase
MENDYYLSQTAVFREGDTVVDVGAHVGVFSICLAKKYPFIKVYAIEPDPVKYGCLIRNIELNGVTNIVAINKAVSGDGRKERLYISPWNTGWATIKPNVAASQRVLRTIEVKSLTLEQLFQEYKIRHCRLLKISAPGAILETLKGFTRSGFVDLLCGEVDLEECSRSKLELESRRIARQHFWRTFSLQANEIFYSWLHQMPTGMERLPFTRMKQKTLHKGLDDSGSLQSARQVEMQAAASD